MSGRWRDSRFDDPELAGEGLSNLVDIMLVFACGLIAALVSSGGSLGEPPTGGGQEVHQKQELPEVPQAGHGAGAGHAPVGTVYRDPTTGKLFMVRGSVKEAPQPTTR